MKKILFLLIVTFILVVLSCENSFTMNAVSQEKKDNAVKKAVNISSEVTGGFDLKPFIDVTTKNVDASDINIYDFEALIANQYSYLGNTIKFNLEDKIVNLIVPSVDIRGKHYDNIFVRYGYTIKAASNNLLYMCPINKESIQIVANGQKLNPGEFSPFAFYVSLYGFGLGRIEVSKHLNGESLIFGGTYWAKD